MNKFFEKTLIFLLFLSIFLTINSPALFFDYLFHDDSHFFIKLDELGFKHIQFDQNMTGGRFTEAWICSLENFFINKVSDLKWIRFISLILLSIIAYLFFSFLKRFSWSNLKSFLITCSICSLPGFATIIFSASNAYILLSILFGFISFKIAATQKNILLSSIILLFSITIYQTGAMFYWTLLGCILLFTKDKFNQNYNSTILHVLTSGIISMFLYGCILLIAKYSLPNYYVDPNYNVYNPTHNYLDKIKWFITEPVVNSLNLWNIFPSKLIAAILSIFIILTALITFILNFKNRIISEKSKSLIKYLLQPCLFIIIIFLTFLPNIIAPGYNTPYRCLIPLSSLLFMTLIWSLYKLTSYLPHKLNISMTYIVFIVLVLYGGITTFKNILYLRVLPSHIEWNKYKEMAKIVSDKKIDAVHIITQNHDSKNERYDEFGVYTSQYAQDIFPTLFASFREFNIKNEYINPMIYITQPETNKIIFIHAFYVKKTSNEKWVFKSFYDNKKFRESFDFKNELSLFSGMGVILDQSYDIRLPKTWHILNLRN